ncbi:hypothetical protein K474DRAFT_1599853 [Panus rudis PR-1116 ss-1]|nr:hypothetical protein K474DRAFT_1599853 [Panus rudis PR-1116 ss-1]
MFKDDTAFAHYSGVCSQCQKTQYDSNKNINLWDCSRSIWDKSPATRRYSKNQSIQQWTKALLCQQSNKQCSTCKVNLVLYITFNPLPFFVPFIIYQIELKLLRRITIQGQRYQLCGIIYKARFHFTSRSILGNGQV